MMPRSYRLVFPVLLLSVGVFLSRPVWSSEAGIIGHSGGGGGKNCSACHKHVTEAKVSITGPNLIAPGATDTYSVIVSAEKMKTAGIGVSATGGVFTLKDQGVKIIDNQVTHTQPRMLGNDESAKFTFLWTAPQDDGEHFISVSGLAANQDKTPAGDALGTATLSIMVSGSTEAFKLPPAADAGGPYKGMVGENIMFDGRRSLDRDGVIRSYLWDFGDGAVEKSSGNIMHSYRAPGTYVVTLTVTDDDDQSSIAAAVAEVLALKDASHRPPVAVGGGPYTVGIGEVVNFDGSQSNDPDGRIESYSWNFGDGFTGAGAKIGHVYAEPGIYVVKLTVTDSDGLIASAPVVARVIDSISPRIVSFFVTPQVSLTHGPGDAYTQNLGVVAQVQGMPIGENGRTCGVIYIERNESPFRSDAVCFSADENNQGKVTLSYPVTFAAHDIPEVNWAAYVILDTGERSEISRASTRVTVYK